MSGALNRGSILKKTVQVGGSTLLSRVLGLARSVLLVRYLGADIAGEAFRAAYKLPNLLRQIFAEGALSAAVVPTFVSRIKAGDSKKQLNGLMSLAFLVFEGTVLLLCALAMWKAQWLVSFFAPGFQEDKLVLAVRFFRLLMPFIFFISSSALLAGALQSLHHFWVPALSPAWLNIAYITALLLGVFRGFPVEFLCATILFGGFVQLLAHLFVYIRLGFGFSGISRYAWNGLRSLLAKFLPATVGMSVLQLSAIVDGRFASYLPHSFTIMEIASGFLRIPLGVFAVAFSTILLPHFARVRTYAPRRLSFYLLEASKFVFWVMVPATAVLWFFAEKIFITLYLSKKFPLALVHETKHTLSAFLLGLFFLSLNKVLMNMYYALHKQWIPAVVVILGTTSNYFLNLLLVEYWQTVGLAFATSVSAMVQAGIFLFVLWRWFKFKLYCGQFLFFVVRYLVQLASIFSFFYSVYRIILWLVSLCAPATFHLVVNTAFIWVWVFPLCGILFYTIYKTRSLFKVKIHFLG